MPKLRDIDESVRVRSEWLARKIPRRSILGKATTATFGLIAAVAAGSLRILPADALSCSCGFPHSTLCGGCPDLLEQSGCPSGCSFCTTSDGCGGLCPWAGGWWTTDSCCGTCNGGFYQCSDCICPTGGGCGAACGCKSGCLCHGCCSPSAVADEIRRLVALYGPSGPWRN